MQGKWFSPFPFLFANYYFTLRSVTANAGNQIFEPAITKTHPGIDALLMMYQTETLQPDTIRWHIDAHLQQ
jgi:hypothetical protein